MPTVKLTPGERFAIRNNLPVSGGLMLMRTVKAAHEVLKFTEAEEDLFRYDEQPVPDQPGRLNITWNLDGLEEEQTLVELELTDAVRQLIKDQLRKLEQDNQLTLDLVEIYDKFITEVEEPVKLPTRAERRRSGKRGA